MSCFKGFPTDEQNEMLLALIKLKNCSLCPHTCNADRTIFKNGFCKSGSGFMVSSIVAHYGEEPVISGRNGICNVFFEHCNLQCVFCQNHQISCNSTFSKQEPPNLNQIISEIIEYLDSGCHAIGFVSPSHMVEQMKIIINAVHLSGRNPVIVYNTNAYDKVDVLKSLEGIVDVYLPDMKYMDSTLAKNYSKVNDYPRIAGLALQEMHRQKGSTLITDEQGRAISGLIIRHLILPGEIENSKKVLNFIADEVSEKVNISLMSQYYPCYNAYLHPSINRTLTEAEYNEVIEEFEKLNFKNGWFQDLGSSSDYRPDFSNKTPF